MADTQTQLRVRNASAPNRDVDFILAAWDSTLPFLASVGAGGMWGDEPFSTREGEKQEIIDTIHRWEENEAEDGRRFLIIEQHRLGSVESVGAALIRDSLPTYLTEHVKIYPKSLLYLEVLIADHRRQRRCRGIGRALIDALEQRARLRGKQALYVDVWQGNDQKLNRYYEGLGFSMIVDYELARGDGTKWLGRVYGMDF